MPLQFSTEIVLLSAIDMADSQFRISDPRSLTPLIDSIQAVGLLVPPLVIPMDGDRYRIVSGFARIAACQKLAVENLLVRIAASDTSATELIRAAVSENALARELTVMEKTRVVMLLQKGYPDPKAVTDVVQSLGIAESPELVTKLSRLAHLPVFIQQAVEKGVVGLAMALAMGRLESDAAQRLIQLYQMLRLGLNRQREVLTLIQEIAKRESLPITAVLAADEISAAIYGAAKDRARRRSLFLHYLKKRRYPVLTQKEELFSQLRQRLQLGPKVQINPPPYFEDGTYQLVLGFDSLDELDQRYRKVGEIKLDPNLIKWLG